jgi:hypothetical protein
VTVPREYTGAPGADSEHDVGALSSREEEEVADEGSRKLGVLCASLACNKHLSLLSVKRVIFDYVSLKSGLL